MKKIVIVEDNKDMQFLLTNILQDEGYKVFVEEDVNVLQQLDNYSPDLVLLDIRLPGRMDGMQILKEIKKKNKEIVVIMITAYGEVKKAVKAIKLGAYDYITKPFNNDELLITIKKALESKAIPVA